MARDTRSTVRASGRFQATAAQLGFSPPPVALRLKLLAGSPHWTLFIQPLGSAPLGALITWLEPWSPLRVEFGSRRVLRADFDPLPAAWGARYRSLDLEMLRLLPSGEGIATVSGPRAAIASLGRILSEPGSAPLDVHHLGDVPSDVRLLTKAQDEALRTAVDAGYYKIPRPINLHQLADRLGISCASLSERLRRAEGRVIMRYVTEGGRSPWDERTLYDAHPSAPPLAADKSDDEEEQKTDKEAPAMRGAT